MNRLLYAALASLLLPTSALADDGGAERLMETEWCLPITRLSKNLRKFEKLKPEKRDRVGPILTYVFTLKEGELPPERLELRDGGQTRVIPLTRKDRKMESANLAPLVQSARDTGEVCIIDPAREGRPMKEAGYNLAFGFDIQFTDTPGTHSLEDLKDGGKDGRSHWKKMVGAMGFIMPKFDHVAVSGDDDDPPAVTALREGEALGTLEGEFLEGARLIDLDDIEDMGAGAIRVEAADYRLTPSPDAKTVRRFMGGGDDDKGGED